MIDARAAGWLLFVTLACAESRVSPSDPSPDEAVEGKARAPTDPRPVDASSQDPLPSAQASAGSPAQALASDKSRGIHSPLMNSPARLSADKMRQPGSAPNESLGSEPEPSQPNPARRTWGVLNCRARVEGAFVELTLSWTNTTKAALWVASALPRQSGSKVKPDPLAADVVQGREGVVLIRKLFPVPPSVRVEAPETPYWQRIPPGGTYKGRMSLTLPLTERVPYAGEGAPGALGTPKEVRCTLGVIPTQGDAPPGHGPKWLEAQELLQGTARLFH